MEKIHPQVYRLPAATIRDFEAHSYLFLGDEPTLMDTAFRHLVEPHFVPALQELGLKLSDIARIINTHAHPDHLGGNGVIQAASPQVQILVHEDDEPMTRGPASILTSAHDMAVILKVLGKEEMYAQREKFIQTVVGDFRVSRFLKHGETIDLGKGIELQVLHAPGHTPGSAVFYWEREGMLFTGDAVQGRSVFPGELPLYFMADAYMRTAARLAELEVKTLCLAHGFQSRSAYNFPVRRGEGAKDFIRESLELAKKVDAAVVTVLHEDIDRNDLVRVAASVMEKLKYDLPVIYSRALGLPLPTLACVRAHLLDRLAEA